MGSAWGVAKVSAFDSSGGLVSGAPQREGKGGEERMEDGGWRHLERGEESN